jgi:hypothetical protein
MKLGFQVLCSVSLGLALIACSGDDNPTTDGGGMIMPTTGGTNGPTNGPPPEAGPCDGVMCPAATMCNPATGQCDPTNMPCPCEKGSHCEPTTNTCVTGCKDNADCNNGEMCDATGTCVAGCEGTLVPGLALSKVVLNQAVSIPLVENGAAVPAASRPAPIVQNRPGLLRIAVTPDATYVPTEVTAVLTLNNAGVETKLTAVANVTAASSESTLEGTLNIKLDAAAIGPSTQYKVELTQKACAATPGAGRFPVTGAQALEATKTGRFKVTVVPYEVAPHKLDVSPAALQGIKDALMAYYPVEGIDAEFHAPVVVPATMTLQKLLQEVRTLRATEKPTDDTYYFGLFTAAATFRDFCKDGCVAGIATLGGAGDSGAAADRYGVGIGYLSETAITSHGMPTTEKAVTYNVMAHELGHTQGRPHSPCGDPAGLDMGFPNATADIETAGYNIVTGTFAAPMTHKDVMGYCDPNWIHPYTYNNLAKRVTAVSMVKGPLKIPGPVVEYASVLVQSDGESFWGNNFTLDEQPSGEKIVARAFDASGAVVADEIEVTITQLGEQGDVIATLPPPAPSWVAVEINGHRVPVN